MIVALTGVNYANYANAPSARVTWWPFPINLSQDLSGLPDGIGDGANGRRHSGGCIVTTGPKEGPGEMPECCPSPERALGARRSAPLTRGVYFGTANYYHA